jgi:hypothetical protein
MPTRATHRSRPSKRGTGTRSIAAAGMGALAAVARGSHEEPQPIALRYEPPDAAGPLVAAVGKASPSTRAALDEAEGVADGGEVRHVARRRRARGDQRDRRARPAVWLVCVVAATENAIDGWPGGATMSCTRSTARRSRWSPTEQRGLGRPAAGRGGAERRARMAATTAQESAERMRSRLTTPVNSAEGRVPGHAGVPRDPRAAIVGAAVRAKFAPSAQGGCATCRPRCLS